MWAEEEPSSVGPGETEESLQLYPSLQSLSSPSTVPPVGDHAFNTWPYKWDLIIKTSHFLTCIYCFFPDSTLAKIFVIIWVSSLIPSWLEDKLFFLSLRFVLWARIWSNLVPWALEKSMFQRDIYKCWSEHTGWWCSWLYATYFWFSS